MFIQDALLQLTRHSDLGNSRGSARLEQYLRGSGGSWIHGGQAAQAAVRVAMLGLGFLLGLLGSQRRSQSQTQHGGSSRICFETGLLAVCSLFKLT